MYTHDRLLRRAHNLLSRNKTATSGIECSVQAVALITLARELRESEKEEQAAFLPAEETSAEIPTPPGFTGFTLRLRGPTGCGKTTAVSVLRAQGYTVMQMNPNPHTEDYLVWPPGQAPEGTG